MKAVMTAVAIIALGAPSVAAAQPAYGDVQLIKTGHKAKHHGKGHGKKHQRGWDDDRDERRAYHEGYREGRRDSRYGYRSYDGGGYHRWSRGQVLPYEYRRQPVYNYDDYGWGPPPRGHAYYRTSTGDIILAAIATGIIVSILSR